MYCDIVVFNSSFIKILLLTFFNLFLEFLLELFLEFLLELFLELFLEFNFKFEFEFDFKFDLFVICDKILLLSLFTFNIFVKSYLIFSGVSICDLSFILNSSKNISFFNISFGVIYSSLIKILPFSCINSPSLYFFGTILSIKSFTSL